MRVMPDNSDRKRDKSKANTYTCNEYREEMILLGLRQKLKNTELSSAEKSKLEKEIKELEDKIGF